MLLEIWRLKSSLDKGLEISPAGVWWSIIVSNNLVKMPMESSPLETSTGKEDFYIIIL